jgi:four helix bundle protein
MGHSTIHSYRDLKVWQQGMELAKVCYELTRGFSRDELFGMTSQIRRSATSIPANIAEGNGRENRGDYIHSLRIAQGSLKELETHLLLSEQIGLTSSETTTPILDRCEALGKMLRALIRSLQKGSDQRSPSRSDKK